MSGTAGDLDRLGQPGPPDMHQVVAGSGPSPVGPTFAQGGSSPVPAALAPHRATPPAAAQPLPVPPPPSASQPPAPPASDIKEPVRPTVSDQAPYAWAPAPWVDPWASSWQQSEWHRQRDEWEQSERHPARPRGVGRGALAAAVLVAFIVGTGAGAGIWRVSRDSPTGATITGGTQSIVKPATPAPSVAPGSGIPTPSGQAAGSGDSSGSSSTGTPNPTPRTGGAVSGSVEQTVDPAVVDITNTLADGSGEAAGTGMIITSNGEVLTNNHVVEGAGTLSVLIGGVGRPHSATVLGVDPADDVALIRIDNVSDLPTVNTAALSTVHVGDRVVALGNALGRQGTPTPARGSVTALDQTITATDDTGANSETLNGLIETNAPIQPGDSGGPLVDSSGQVIGMDTAATVGRSRFRTTAGNGYAIPVETALQIAHRIENGDFTGNVQTATRPLLGVQAQDASGSTGGGASSGALIVGLQSGTPASRSGLAAGDVITGIDGTAVSDATSLGTAIRTHRVGDTVTVDWVDPQGQTHSAPIQLVAGPPA